MTGRDSLTQTKTQQTHNKIFIYLFYVTLNTHFKIKLDSESIRTNPAFGIDLFVFLK